MHQAEDRSSTLLATIVIVNFNGRTFLDDCISSVERQDIPRHLYEILLIDNASSDDSIEYLRKHFPSVRAICLSENIGFTGANNLGFRLARGRWVVLLNNDTRVEAAWLRKLIEAAQGPMIGGVASRLMFRDAPGEINSTGLEIYRDGRAGDRQIHQPVEKAENVRCEIFGGCGASLLLNREMLNDVGGFDSDFFMYYEDFDLAWRARLRGWSFVFAPDSVVHHICGGSSDSAFRHEQIERNRVALALSNAPVWTALWASMGCLARTARSLVAFAAGWGDPTISSASHVRASLRALVSAIFKAPFRLLMRYETRIARRKRSDREITRFIRPIPIRG